MKFYRQAWTMAAVLGIIAFSTVCFSAENNLPIAIISSEGLNHGCMLLDSTGNPSFEAWFAGYESESDGTIVSYSWDFGDGSSEVFGEIDGMEDVTHYYAKSGVYNVSLEVTDDLGQIDVDEMPLYISNPGYHLRQDRATSTGEYVGTHGGKNVYKNVKLAFLPNESAGLVGESFNAVCWAEFDHAVLYINLESASSQDELPVTVLTSSGDVTLAHGEKFQTYYETTNLSALNYSVSVMANPLVSGQSTPANPVYTDLIGVTQGTTFLDGSLVAKNAPLPNDGWPQIAIEYKPRFPKVGEPVEMSFSYQSPKKATVDYSRWLVQDGGLRFAKFYGSKATYTFDTPGIKNINLQMYDSNNFDPSLNVSIQIGGVVVDLLDGVDFSSGYDVTTDTALLAASTGPSVTGIAADGTARVVLRAHTPEAGRVTFSLTGTGNVNEDGMMRAVGGSQNTDKVVVDTVAVGGENWAFAVYQAPKDFVRAANKASDSVVSERTMPISISFVSKTDQTNNSTASRELKIVRPPLVLVHGLWGGATMWAQNDFVGMLTGKVSGLDVHLVDYSSTNSAHFEENRGRLLRAINKVIRPKYYEMGVALVKVDVVGYSMGGVLARIEGSEITWKNGTMVQTKGNYDRLDNYYSGDINRFISLDSVHKGSFLADIGVAFRNSLDFAKREVFLSMARKKGYSFDEGALDDLMTINDNLKTGRKLKELGDRIFKSPSHVIGGDYVVMGDLVNLPGNPGILFRILNIYGCNTNVDVIPGRSDLVVSLESQLGGLRSEASSVLNQWHGDVTTQQVAEKIVALLNSDEDALFDKNTWGKK